MMVEIERFRELHPYNRTSTHFQRFDKEVTDMNNYFGLMTRILQEAIGKKKEYEKIRTLADAAVSTLRRKFEAISETMNDIKRLTDPEPNLFSSTSSSSSSSSTSVISASD